ncbi:MAG: hypothetical protein JXB13_01305 [Phycisphaerae bacterium]|nr:hypothetical protein [Phycisphaerae bacterium]
MNETDRISLDRKRRRRTVVIVLLLLTSVAVLYAGFRYYVHERRRGIYMALYGNAIMYYQEGLGERLPDTLDELERRYNASSLRVHSVPLVPSWPRPEYRPPGDLEGGPFLVMIENPPYWFDSGRYVRYARANGELGPLELCSNQEVEARIAEDDRLRAAIRSAHSKKTETE